MKEKIAKVIRVLSVPPILVTALLLILYFAGVPIFNQAWDLAAGLAFLAGVPLLAYPVSWIVPPLRAKGREGQRNLAFIFTGAGYLFALLYGFLMHCRKGLLLIFTAYFISVVLLLIMNKLIKLRASGHACSVTSPVLFLSLFLGAKGVLTAVACYAAIFWASLVTKRHTWKEFLMGTLTCGVSFAAALLILNL